MHPMGLVELFLIAVSLSMDAFAVALCKGLSMKRLHIRSAVIIALFFGGFQAAMPLAGWLLGKQFARYITTVDHWIAFGLLALIGGKMIHEALMPEECPAGSGEVIRVRELVMLSVATSIDALAVGITFAFLQVRILPAVLFIGIITFGLSFAGVCAGHRFGSRIRQKAELGGGIILIGIGLKILLEHHGVFG